MDKLFIWMKLKLLSALETKKQLKMNSWSTYRIDPEI